MSMDVFLVPERGTARLRGLSGRRFEAGDAGGGDGAHGGAVPPRRTLALADARFDGR